MLYIGMLTNLIKYIGLNVNLSFIYLYDANYNVLSVCIKLSLQCRVYIFPKYYI